MSRNSIDKKKESGKAITNITINFNSVFLFVDSYSYSSPQLIHCIFSIQFSSFIPPTSFSLCDEITAACMYTRNDLI